MGGTTAIVLVTLIIALMLIIVMAVLVWGYVRSLEVRHSTRAHAVIPAIAHEPPVAPTPAAAVNGTSLRHPIFEQDKR